MQAHRIKRLLLKVTIKSTHDNANARNAICVKGLQTIWNGSWSKILDASEAPRHRHLRTHGHVGCKSVQILSTRCNEFTGNEEKWTGLCIGMVGTTQEVQYEPLSDCKIGSERFKVIANELATQTCSAYIFK